MKMAQLPSIFGGAAVSLEEQAGRRKGDWTGALYTFIDPTVSSSV